MIAETPPQVFGKSDIENITLERCKHIAPGFLGNEALSITTEILPIARSGVEIFNFHNSISSDIDGLCSALAIF